MFASVLRVAGIVSVIICPAIFKNISVLSVVAIGRLTVVNDVLPLKVLFPKLVAIGKFTEIRDVQVLKALYFTIITKGKLIEVNDVQS